MMLRVDCHVWIEAEGGSDLDEVARTLAEGVGVDCEVFDSEITVVDVSNTIVDGWKWGAAGDPM